jgi:hypothetical protein
MLGLFAAGVFVRAIPRWLAWSALALGIAGLTPYGYFASVLVLLWAAVAGIALTMRGTEPAAIHVRADVQEARPA